jgi:TP901 family phage tail tape measure protein
MAGQVTFILNADEQKAVQAYLKLVNAQNKSVQGARQLAKETKGIGDEMASIGAGWQSTVAGFASAGTLKAVFSNIGQYIDTNREKVVGFEDQMTGLLSLGDNTSNIAGMKGQVLDLSSAWGVSREEMAKTLFDLQSGTANLSKKQQNDLLNTSLRMTQLGGGGLANNLNALTKLFQIYRDETGSVDATAGKMFTTMELGAINIDELSTYIADVAAPAKAMGIGFNDLGAAIITATNYGGKTEKTMTGIRNVILELTKAEEKGIHLTGSLSERLTQLKGVSQDQMLELFGHESIAVASVLVAHSDELKNNVEAVRTASGGIIDERLTKRLSDTSAMFAEISKGLQKSIENAGLGGNFVRDFGKESQQLQGLELGMKSSLSPAMQAIGVGKVAQTLGEVEIALGFDKSGIAGKLTREGIARQIVTLREQGKKAEADALELAHLHDNAGSGHLRAVAKKEAKGWWGGTAFGSDLAALNQWTNELAGGQGESGFPFPAGSPLAGQFLHTDAKDAERLMKLRATGFDMPMANFIALRKDEELAKAGEAGAKGRAGRAILDSFKGDITNPQSEAALRGELSAKQGYMAGFDDAAVEDLRRAARLLGNAAEKQLQAADSQHQAADKGRLSAFNPEAHN